MVSISGGSDSDIMLDVIEKCRYPHNEIEYVFFDTGVELKATKDHLNYLEDKYKIEIKRLSPKKTIVKSCKEDGQPVFSKIISESIGRLQKNRFSVGRFAL